MSDIVFRVGMLMYPGITQLDMNGPLEVLSAVESWQVDLVAKTRESVRCGRGFSWLPTTSFAEAPQYDLLVVPGGPGVDDAMLDPRTVDFVREQSAGARYVFGICTGPLLLGAAGCLHGLRASCHWQSADLLADFGATPTRERMTTDGRFFTSGGVTAGIDMALKVVGDLVSTEAAQTIQLLLEYDPAPPFDSGSPDRAPRAVREQLDALSQDRMKRRQYAIARAAAILHP